MLNTYRVHWELNLLINNMDRWAMTYMCVVSVLTLGTDNDSSSHEGLSGKKEMCFANPKGQRSTMCV